MKKFFILLIAIILLLSGCGFSEKSKLQPAKKLAAQVDKKVPPHFQPKKLTIVSVGDSLTEGVGDDQGGYLLSLKSMLEKKNGVSDVQCSNFGVKGIKTTQLIKNVKSPKQYNAIKKADMVIITIGGNDIMQVAQQNLSNLQLPVFMQEKEVYISHLTQVFDTITQENPRAEIVLIGIYNPFVKWFANITELDQIISDWNRADQIVVANFPHAYYVNIQDLFLHQEENLLSSDNFHPNDKGYELIAQRIYDKLDQQAIPDLEKSSNTRN